MPSERHIELQNMIIRWLDNRTVKMSGLPECQAVGYVADYVAIVRMLDAEHSIYAAHSGLEKKISRCVYGGKDKPLVNKVIGDIDRHYCCVFEVKVSRNDFLGTFGGKESPHSIARMKPVGTAHWIVADKGVCSAEEVPDFWGLLEPYGGGLSEKKKPKLNILSETKLHAIAFEMFFLQMNSRYSYHEQLRDMSEKIKDVQEAICRGKPIGEIHRRANQAVKVCRGFV